MFDPDRRLDRHSGKRKLGDERIRDIVEISTNVDDLLSTTKAELS